MQNNKIFAYKCLFLGVILFFLIGMTPSFAAWSEENTFTSPTLSSNAPDSTNCFGVKVLGGGSLFRVVGVKFYANSQENININSDASTVLYSNTSGGDLWANFTDAELEASTYYSFNSPAYGGRVV